MFSGAESSNPYGLRDGEVSSGVSGVDIELIELALLVLYIECMYAFMYVCIL